MSPATLGVILAVVGATVCATTGQWVGAIWAAIAAMWAIRARDAE